MAENKKSVLLYCDIIHTIEPLTDEEAGKLFKHYLRYINDQNPCAEDRLTALLFEPIKQNLKRDLRKWEDKSLKNKEIANMRWHKKDANVCERINTDANNADKDKVIVKDKVKDKDINIPFDTFWDLYNKKVGSKDSCLSKWNKLKDEERQKIIDTLPTFLKSISDKKFQPHPQTYLNQSRWNDEIVISEKNEDKFKCEDMNPFGFFYPLLTQKEFDERIKINPHLRKL
jgi:hypothetical protein